MPTVKYKATGPARMTAEEKARIAQMTDAAIHAAADSDPDGKVMSDEDYERNLSKVVAREARKATGLSQAKFAEAYRMPVRTFQAWESGRTVADSTALTYLRLILADWKKVRDLLQLVTRTP